MITDPAYWEAILASEGMAEVSLFDNTGKNSKAVTFISATIPCETHSEAYFDVQASWQDVVNIDRFGEPTSVADLDEAAYWREVTIAVASLPPGWPALDKELLSLYADTGHFEASLRKLGISRNVAYAIKRRFESWRKNQMGLAT